MSRAYPESVLPPELPLADGWSLPASWYRDPAVHELERDRVFSSAWQYGGPAEWVATPGSHFPTQVGHIPLAVVRDKEGALRAFVNVCRHRGHLVVGERGCRETLQCPYHAWTYALDGTLRRAPRSEREPGFDPDLFSLLPASVDTWGPFVFVNSDPAAAPLAETLGDLPEMVAGSGLDLDVLKLHSHYEWPVDVNWKVAIENYLECYHCPVAHPGFSKVIDVDPDSYVLRAGPTFSSQLGPVRASALERPEAAPYDPHGEITQSQYHFLFPLTTINIDPGPQNISVERWIPLGSGKTVEVTDLWFGADVPPERAQEIIEFGSQVSREDIELCLSVQAGLDSGAVTQGRVLRETEQLIVDFQRRLAAAIGAGP
ncbi:MAG: aromatic ring-hydroxylating oxygenase subunit alpha [Gaiella sp.]